ncbi:mitochondrial ubiquitin ligase activator of nfkb 1 isoform X2 [Folsomia candida]|uniref:RING-type E3 ubiquitin transferase n=1 Tax=Folsomia candida TaxID=158441 RepID=A0A226CX14_FOLCA|nr:mitochondrial ubiquitin ligase activator of nfkb 1 isoform X2 [Folsomia candida]OXA37164.1 Mitochondrial ubiquitin ligase activator of nfkb 1 [Folsomia candida]
MDLLKALIENLPAGSCLILTELVVTGLNAYVVYGMLKACKASATVLDTLQGIQSFNVGRELAQAVDDSPTQALEYVAVRGKVSGYQDPVIPSSAYGLPSVIRKTKNLEIVSKYAWDLSIYTMNGRSYETSEFSPFRLRPITETQISFDFNETFAQQCDKGGKICSAEMISPSLIIKDLTQLHMEGLLKILPTYYETVDEPNSSSFKILKYIFGLTTPVGIKKTEALLACGEVITAFGKVQKTGEHEYTLIPPMLSNSLYILTPSTYEEIVDKHYVEQITAYLKLLFVSAGAVFVLWDLVRRMRILYKSIYPETIIQIENKHDTVTAKNTVGETLNQQLCIVCQEAPRNIVLLNCRHFCLCQSCYDILQNRGQNCPVCRSNVEGKIEVFVS